MNGPSRFASGDGLLEQAVQILFITSNRLGDAVLSTGILAALLDSYPGAAVTVACGPLPAPLFRAVPQVRRVIELKKQPYAAHWRDLWASTLGTRWSIVVDLRQSLVSRLIFARRRFIWKKQRQRLHKVEELAGVVQVAPVPAPRVWYDTEALVRAETLVANDRPVLALAPGANSTGKKWPAERYAALADRMTRLDGLLPNGRVLLLGDRNDSETVAPIVAALEPDRVIDLTGMLGIAETAACLTRADFYVGNDSGLTHLAAAAGVPTLALFGPGVAWKYRPWGRHAAYLSKADDPARDYDLCRNGDDEAALALMRRLSVADVEEAATALWRRTQP